MKYLSSSVLIPFNFCWIWLTIQQNPKTRSFLQSSGFQPRPSRSPLLLPLSTSKSTARRVMTWRLSIIQIDNTNIFGILFPLPYDQIKTPIPARSPWRIWFLTRSIPPPLSLSQPRGIWDDPASISRSPFLLNNSNTGKLCGGGASLCVLPLCHVLLSSTICRRSNPDPQS